MFKKLLSTIVFTILVVGAYGQTIVSTTPENKKVVLEEFTGIHCQFCPDGHARAQAIQDANPGNVFLINVHAGGYANPGSGEPDFRTPYGQALADQSQLAGYPAGTINRHNFPGFEMNGSPAGATAQGRGTWATTADMILDEGSYLNMAVEATIDVQARELTVHVESYYTGDSPEASNLLNVALLQNNTLGPQTGSGAGNEYVHQHRLVDLLNGQWGESVSPTTEGSFIDKTYTYTVPADYNGVPAKLEDMEVVVFMTETHQELISGNGVKPTYTNLALDNDANLTSVSEILEQCEGSSFSPEIEITNYGNDPITSLDIEYSVNGGNVETYTFTGNLASYEAATVSLPEITYTSQSTNTVHISLADDENNANNDSSIDFDQTTIDAAGNLFLEFSTDQYGEEAYFEITDNNYNVIESGGPFGNNQTYNLDFILDAGCYNFHLIDTYGDGGGAVRLYDGAGTVIYETNGNYGSGARTGFSSDGVLGINDNDFSGIAIYPNPASDILNIKNAENASITVFDITGKLLLSKNNISSNETLNVSSLTTGTYFVKVSNGKNVQTEKLIITN